MHCVLSRGYKCAPQGLEAEPGPPLSQAGAEHLRRKPQQFLRRRLTPPPLHVGPPEAKTRAEAIEVDRSSPACASANPFPILLLGSYRAHTIAC